MLPFPVVRTHAQSSLAPLMLGLAAALTAGAQASCAPAPNPPSPEADAAPIATPRCEVMTPTSAPTLVAPAAGAYLQPEGIPRFEASIRPRLQDATRNRIVEFELRRVVGIEPILKVWSASLPFSGGDSSSASPALSLDAGTFESGFTSLESWQEYAVRARYRDGGSLCEFSPWSDFRHFHIDDGSEALFNEDIIRDLRITLDADSARQIDAEALPPGCVPYHRNYYPGTITFDGQTFDRAGVRVKGGCGSARSLTGKASFKINLSDFGIADQACPVSRRVRGLKRITVNNGVQDRSHTHERLAYEFYDLVGVPVPRRAPIRVFVNDELWGLYLHLESIDRRFLKRRYPGLSAAGMLYEGTYFCDLIPRNRPGVDGPETCFSMKFTEACTTPELYGDAYNYAPLNSFIDRIKRLPVGGFYPAITQFVDFEAYLSEWAADSIMNNWDSAIFRTRNNFRVYHDPVADQWVFIPTGVDQTWNEGQLPIDPWRPRNIIARRCLREKACEDAFAARLIEVLSLFEGADFATKAESIRLQIADEVAADPRKEANDFSQRVDATVAFIQGRPDTIRAWLSEHGY